MTFQLYGAFIETSKTEPEQARFNFIIKRLVEALPEIHYSTLRYLARHLSRVAGKSNVNQMTAHNLAIVFAPTLIQHEDTLTMGMNLSHHRLILETIFDNSDFFFPPDQDQVDPVGRDNNCKDAKDKENHSRPKEEDRRRWKAPN